MRKGNQNEAYLTLSIPYKICFYTVSVTYNNGHWNQCLPKRSPMLRPVFVGIGTGK